VAIKRATTAGRVIYRRREICVKDIKRTIKFALMDIAGDLPTAARCSFSTSCRVFVSSRCIRYPIGGTESKQGSENVGMKGRERGEKTMGEAPLTRRTV